MSLQVQSGELLLLRYERTDLSDGPVWQLFVLVYQTVDGQWSVCLLPVYVLLSEAFAPSADAVQPVLLLPEPVVFAAGVVGLVCLAAVPSDHLPGQSVLPVPVRSAPDAEQNLPRCAAVRCARDLPAEKLLLYSD